MKLVIFDCDGTLVDSAASIVEAMEAAFRKVGRTAPSPRAIRNTIGLSLEILIGRLAEEPEIVPELTQAFRDYRINAPDVGHGLFPGARAAINELSLRNDILLGIATGKSRRGLNAALAHNGFDTHFITTRTADEAPSKPNPGMVEMCMEEAGVSKDDTLVIGDTTYDIEMARNAGAAAIGVTWGSHDATALLAAGAHSVVFDFPRLLPAIDGFFGRNG